MCEYVYIEIMYSLLIGDLNVLMYWGIWINFNNNIGNRGKENYATTSHQGSRPKIIEFGWMDHH